uniref:Uncharacterized protein n=1 Tax=Anguilla anguilla TaxID=7936 RepID=A0A0E9W887_ANGAN
MYILYMKFEQFGKNWPIKHTKITGLNICLDILPAFPIKNGN